MRSLETTDHSEASMTIKIGHGGTTSRDDDSATIAVSIQKQVTTGRCERKERTMHTSARDFPDRHPVRRSATKRPTV